jgi:hypothetical protein
MMDRAELETAIASNYKKLNKLQFKVNFNYIILFTLI